VLPPPFTYQPETTVECVISLILWNFSTS